MSTPIRRRGLARAGLLLTAAATVTMLLLVGASAGEAAGAEGCVTPDVFCETAGGAPDSLQGASGGSAASTDENSGGGEADTDGGDTTEEDGEGGGVSLGLPSLGGVLGGGMAEAVTQGWTAAMQAVWGAGRWVLQMAMVGNQNLLTPDVSADGPGAQVYRLAFWVASVLVVFMAMVQLGWAAIRREGQGLARVLVGSAQFVIVWAAWLGWCVLVIQACSGLTRAILHAALGVADWGQWEPLDGFDAGDVGDAAMATVLGFLGAFMWVGAIGHLLVMLGRAVALLVLVATGPIAAAGLASDAGRSWFWKSLRWFHAAALTPVVMAGVLGIGVGFADAAAAGMATGAQTQVATAVPAVVAACVTCVAPLALFKLLAFVDPGSPSGASMRQGLAAQGGIQGLLGGGGEKTGGRAASTMVNVHGKSAGEAGAQAAGGGRLAAAKTALAKGGGAAGAGVAVGMSVLAKVGTHGTALVLDQGNQSGVGHTQHGPDFSAFRAGPAAAGGGSRGSSSRGGRSSSPGPEDDDHVHHGGDRPPPPPTAPEPTVGSDQTGTD